MGEASTLFTSTSDSPKAEVTSPQVTSPRRIVKATVPKPPSAKGFPPIVLNTPTNDDNADTEKERREYPLAVERNAENAEKWREDRIKATEKRSKALREQKLFERRTNPSGKVPSVNPNPFSRFLSVFSVEPEHPEHKRSFDDGDEEGKSQMEGPTGKRLKLSDSEGKSGKPDQEVNNSKIPTVWLVAAAAIVAAIAFKAFAKKK